MKAKNILLIMIGIITGIIYLIIAKSIQNTEYIWYVTRIFGLIAYLALSLLVISGETRMLGLRIGAKFHIPSGVFTAYLALLHGLSALFDKFMWGKNLHVLDYLGFNFSDKWLSFMSLGVIAFYLIIIISITSAQSVPAKMGFKKWKLIHYISYFVYFLVFLHAIILGTDLKQGNFKYFFLGLFLFFFLFSTVLLVVRLIKSFFMDKSEILIMILIVFLASVSMSYAISKTAENADITNEVKQQIYFLNYNISSETQQINILNANINLYQKTLNDIRSRLEQTSQANSENQNIVYEPIETNQVEEGNDD